MARLPTGIVRLRVSAGRRASSSSSNGASSSATLLRQVMRSVAQPVAVITVPLKEGKGKGKLSEQHDHGATLSSLSSISLSPPLIAFSLRLPSRLASYLLPSDPSSSAPKLRVHLLSSSQETIARAFARQAPLPAPASPSPPPSSTTPDNPFPPSLFKELENTSLGYLDCEVVSTTELPKFGGHEMGPNEAKSQLFIARVDEVQVPPGEGGLRGSLVYWEQGYRAVT